MANEQKRSVAGPHPAAPRSNFVGRVRVHWGTRTRSRTGGGLHRVQRPSPGPAASGIPGQLALGSTGPTDAGKTRKKGQLVDGTRVGSRTERPQDGQRDGGQLAHGQLGGHRRPCQIIHDEMGHDRPPPRRQKYMDRWIPECPARRRSTGRANLHRVRGVRVLESHSLGRDLRLLPAYTP